MAGVSSVGGVDELPRAGNSHHACDGRDRPGIVTGNHVESYALLAKIADGLSRTRANLIANGDEANGPSLAYHVALVRKPVHAGNHKHAARIGESRDAVLDQRERMRREYKLGRAHDEGAFVKRGSAPFFR